jgi:ABC-2 type transport system permease protein
VRRIRATFVRNWIVVRRAYPWSFLVGNLLSGLYTVVVAYFTYHVLAGGELGSEFAAYAGTGDYISYVILGAGVYLFAARIMLGVSRSLITERREGTLESLLLAPAGRLGYFAAVTAQWALACAGEMGVMLLLAWPLGLNLGRINLSALALAFPVTLVGLFGMSLVLGAVMLATGDTYLSQNTLFAFMALVSGFTFPPAYLPRWLQWAGAALPVTGGLRLLREAVLQGRPVAAISRDLIVYTLLGLAYAAIGLGLMRTAERRALEGMV